MAKSLGRTRLSGTHGSQESKTDPLVARGDVVRRSVYLPKALWHEIRRAAVDRDVPPSVVLIEMLERAPAPKSK